jgi:NAD-reducing hydrogenase large subunit
MRRLMHYGQTLQSHALHFFHLCSPDLLFGFDSDVAKRNIIGVIQDYPETAKKAVLLRKYGQEVIKATAGKKIHGTSAVPGGINMNLSTEDRDALAENIDDIVAWAAEAVQLVKTIHGKNPEFYDAFASFPSNHMSLVRPDGTLDLYDGKLRVKDAEGGFVFDQVAPLDYLDYIAEEVRPWSYMKFPYVKRLGHEEGWYRVGPLSRVVNCDRIASPLAEEMRQEFMDYNDGKPSASSLHYHWARMIETVYCAEMIRDYLKDSDLQGDDLIRTGERRNETVALLEAPRGTLFHHYRVNDDDQITMANLIVATTNNNSAMNTAVQRVAEDFLDGKEITEGLLNHVEVAIRAYDPCLSCATHAVGRMPLEVTLLGPHGEIVDRRAKA